MSQPSPTAIRALRAEKHLEVTWNPEPPIRLPFHLVRCLCPCASCIDEISGVRTLDPKTVPDDVMPTHLSFTGNYALKIEWNDGHSTGLYTWDLLREIADQCLKSN